MNNVTVVKIGGALLEDAATAVERIRAIKAGRLAIVHGGGVQITRMLERMNVKSEFIDGLRVTDEAALRGVAAALMGEVHTTLVSTLQHSGMTAIGAFGLVKAERKAGPWGLVGTNVHADSGALNAILEGGMVPVIPTLAIGEASLLNVNGDETATAVALALSAEKLVFLTDVEGVRDASGATIERVPRSVSLSGEAFIAGGMKPKLRAVEAALAGGVTSVWVGRTFFGDAS